MRDLLEAKFFPFVVKPGRYAGGEIGQIVKDWSGRFSYLHAYPDKYELGQSYPGLQILYHLVNRDDRFLCERVFAVDHDAEELMRKLDIPLFSLETSRPAGEFDAFGFTLVDETVYTNMLSMLELARIPIKSEQRGDNHPIILVGGPAVFNPEPIADFVDIAFIGDAEEGLLEVLSSLRETKGLPRRSRLETIARTVEAAYVPSLYDAQHKPLVETIPDQIKARVVGDLKTEYYPAQPLVPLVETTHTHLAVEIMRGCPQGCRFCLATAIYRPVRLRPQVEIIQQVDEQLAATGYEDISLMSLSTTDYPELESLANTLSRRLEPLRVSINLPSLRPGSVTPSLFDAVKRVRKSGLTIAPEAGTERLRLFIRKDFPDAAIYDTARIAFEKGWTTIKLYFMIGLPTETQEDLLGIANICRTVCQIGREFPNNKTVNVTLSTFVPKAHTPFQWDEVAVEAVASEKVAFIRKHTRDSQVHFKVNNTALALLQAILGRGGRELGAAIELAYRNGCRFDGWSEDLRVDTWLSALRETGTDPAESLRAIPFSRVLPWSHIRKGPSVEHLMAERQRTSGQLKEFVPHKIDAEAGEKDDDFQEFGRSKKKVASRNVAAPTKNRVRIRWEKSATYRYMSHLDNLRLLERCIRRARLPVSYSQGFNPTMKLSFGPPLPLGFTSETEFVDITFEMSFTISMLESLRKVLPTGVEIRDARVVLGATASLSSTLNRVIYTVPIMMWRDQTRLEIQLQSALQLEKLEIERSSKGAVRRVDIRSAVHGLTIEQDSLVMLLGLGDGGYARPGEVVQFLTDSLTTDIIALPFHRREMFREEPDGRRIDGMDL